MDETIFWFSVSGLSLQLLGTLVLGFGIIGQRLVHYSPLDALVKLLPNIIPASQAAQFPILSALYVGESSESTNDQRYNNGTLIVALLIYALIPTAVQAGPILLLILELFDLVLIGAIWLGPLLAFNLVINLISVRAQLRILRQNPIWRFFLNWVWSPIIGMAIIVILWLQIILHLFAWMNRFDLSIEDNRIKYYAMYSVSAIFIGTSLLMFALFLSRP